MKTTCNFFSSAPSIRSGLARLTWLSCLAVASATSLSACFPLAATGFAVGGFALVDRRTVGAQTDDRSIELKAASRLGDALESAGGITVTSYNRRVLLTGQAIDAQSRRTAESIVAKIENVRSVQNELAIGRRPSLSSSASDAALTTRVRTSLLEAKDLQSNAVKIVTESGVVYLLGIVTKPEGDRFAELASRVSGVLRVVTMFEYVSEEELARITQNASADKK